jgi:ABC-type transport system substrate-binding protein
MMTKRVLLLVFLAVVLFVFSLATNGLAQTPQRGGVLKFLTAWGPQVLGYYPEMGQYDMGAAYPGVEWLVTMGPNRQLVPFLCESVKDDPKNFTMTFKLRKGIKFHDGSELNAEVAVWNFKMYLEAKKIRYGDLIKSIEINDPYTFTLHMTEWNNQMYFGYGFTAMYSKKAYETNGKEWCRLHPVGTGPFKFVEYKRDAYVKWERFPDYWQKGKPYLDGVQQVIVPDPVTASQMFQAKQVDMWNSASVRDQFELLQKGFKRQSDWPALPYLIYLNTANPNAPTAKLKVREAIEYALDRPAMAKALGFGFYEPLKMVTPQGEWGYDPNFKGRPYDPAMAKKLLAEAGYPNGLKLKLMAIAESGGKNDRAEAIKAYMDQAGFNVDIDIADPGRFFGSLWVTGFDDMLLFLCGLDENFLATLETWFGHSPLTNIVSFKRPPDFIEGCKEASHYTKKRDQKKATEKLVRMISDEALIIPLWKEPVGIMHQNYVHTMFDLRGFIHWASYDDWMEKH